MYSEIKISCNQSAVSISCIQRLICPIFRVNLFCIQGVSILYYQGVIYFVFRGLNIPYIYAVLRGVNISCIKTGLQIRV